MASESVMRAVETNALCGNISLLHAIPSDKHTKAKPSDTLTSTPIASMKNWPDVLANLVGRYDSADLLTWQHGSIPQSEILEKIGADHSEGSFKLALQVFNLDQTNSIKNIQMLCVRCYDKHFNFRSLR